MLEVQEELDVEGAGGHPLMYLGVIEAEFKCPGSTMDDLIVPVLVMPSTAYNRRVPAIIGTNVLDRVQPHPSLAEPWQQALSHLTSAKVQSKEEVALYSCGYVTLQPQQSTVITARLGAKRSYKHGVLEAADSLPGGIRIPQGLIEVDVEDRKVQLCVVNLTEREVYIPKHQKVAVVNSARAIDHTEKKLLYSITREGRCSS